MLGLLNSMRIQHERDGYMTILRAACYCRVSTEEQALRGFSIEAQVANLSEYCEKTQMKLVDFYKDEGISGAKPPLKRPDLKRLLDDVEAGKIDVILFTKLDRWFRSVQEYFKVQEILDKHKVEWKAIHEDYDTSTANGRMAITIFLAIAQNEREKGAERVKAVLENKRKNKEACFGGQAVPFGYKKEPDDGGIMRLVKDPETQDACQDFWDILIKYNNLNKAIRYMQDYYGITKDWKSWARMTASDFYCGVHRGVADFCEPYVSVEDFLKFQDRETIKATRSNAVYLFRTLMRCPVCGHKLCGDSNKKSYGVYKSYRCTNRCRGCTFTTSISEKKMEKELLARLDEFLRGEIARIEAEQTKPKPKPKVNVKALKERHRRLTVAYRIGNVSDDEYIKEDAELKALIAKAENEKPPEPKNPEPLKALLETDFVGVYKTLNEEERQRFWQNLIQEIKLEGKHIKDVIFF